MKSVLASSKFSSAKEVFSKLITETNCENEERQVMAFRSSNRNSQVRNSSFNSSQNFNSDGNRQLGNNSSYYNNRPN